MSFSPETTSPVIFGEVLFDCFEDGSRVLGGAPFNVAWHCQAFGLNPLFISRIGNDALGSEVRLAMHEWGMDLSGLQLDSTYPTGIVDVSFNDGEPSYDIVNNSAWDFIDHQEAIEALPQLNINTVLYHGSLAMRNQVTANALSVLKKHCFNSIFIDINLRSPWWSLSQIENMLKNVRWLKLNVDELELIVSNKQDTQSKARYLLSHFQVDLVVITQGSAGAIAITQKEICSVQPDKVINIIDTVGAGDAFSSILIAGLHYDWPLQTILNRGQQFASAVVEQRGATTQDKQFYKPFIKKWSL